MACPITRITAAWPTSGHGRRTSAFYVPTPVLEEHARELASYEWNTATVRLPLEKKLPIALIQKLVKARVKKNEARHKK
ncbi:MAG TPA: hypothetical protein VFT65_13375 [Candidatus Angelobacter sp.]|nr:hypothetical protein [Candidatus Angelobacter sp.]